MKYLLIIVLTVALFSCKKETVTDKLQGTWELRKSFSGWGGAHDYLPGNGNTIQFNNNSYVSHTKLADTAYSNSGRFTLYMDNDCNVSGKQQFIKFNSDNSSSILTISSDELTMSSSRCMADGGSVTYRKITN